MDSMLVIFLMGMRKHLTEAAEKQGLFVSQLQSATWGGCGAAAWFVEVQLAAATSCVLENQEAEHLD